MYTINIFTKYVYNVYIYIYAYDLYMLYNMQYVYIICVLLYMIYNMYILYIYI